jgi:hypothetical protein
LRRFLLKYVWTKLYNSIDCYEYLIVLDKSDNYNSEILWIYIIFLSLTVHLHACTITVGISALSLVGLVMNYPET